MNVNNDSIPTENDVELEEVGNDMVGSCVVSTTGSSSFSNDEKKHEEKGKKHIRRVSKHGPTLVVPNPLGIIVPDDEKNSTGTGNKDTNFKNQGPWSPSIKTSTSPTKRLHRVITRSNTNKTFSFNIPPEAREPSKCQKIRSVIVSWLEGRFMNALVVIMTVLALFMDDCRMSFADKEADDIFQVITIFIFTAFSLELITRCIVTDGYRFSFFFWLDLIAALSIVPDIEFLWDSSNNTSPNSLTLARAARVSRVGTRVSRLTRLIRLVRVAKLFEGCAKGRDKQIEIANSEVAEIETESKVGAQLSEQTTRKVVIMVLGMLIMIPLLQYSSANRIEESTLNQLVHISNYNVTSDMFLSEIDFVHSVFGKGHELLYLELSGTYHSYTYDRETQNDYRTQELKTVTQGSAIAVFSQKAYSIAQANLSIVLTCLVLLLLAVGAGLINHSTQRIIISPIERMLSSMRRLRAEPLHRLENHNKRDPNSETNLLERTLVKLTRLLQIGLGQSGSRMIQKCLDGAATDLNPMVNGTRIYAIFGFCDIRQFTFATECLQEEVMMYVNSIASILHTEVTNHHGYPNKNVGDAFLSIWRFNDAVKPRDLSAFEAKGLGKPISAVQSEMQMLADNALASFLNCITQLKISKSLSKYKTHPSLLAHVKNEWEISLGYGLHVGWAIEGPIGSMYKIDSSYLSPNVNLSEQLEGMTKYYGVPLLMSGEFYSLLSSYAKLRCRRIDRVKVEGRDTHLDVYTFDLFTSSSFVEIKDLTKTSEDKRFEQILTESQRNGLTGVRGELVEFIAGMNPSFYRFFREGVDFYIAGKWDRAKNRLETALSILPSDIPTQKLLAYIETEAIEGWEGFREHRE